MGKKYVIELCDKPMKDENGNDIWRVKGFNALVFDQNGLDKLEEYKEEMHEFKVGDVCYIPKVHDEEKLLVTKIGPYMTNFMSPDGSQYVMLTREFKEQAVFMYHSKFFEAFLKGDFT